MATPVDLKYTSLEDIPQIRNHLNDVFLSGKTRDVSFRRTQLMQIGYMVQDNVDRINAAITADMGRHSNESNLLEIGPVISEVIEAVKNVHKWAKPTSPAWSFPWVFMRPSIRSEPKGVVVIVAPFNYPLFLSVLPMLGAIAAGNTLVIKPPESSPHFSVLFEELVNKYLDPDVVRVVQGGVAETSELLNLQWDHVFYTGSGRVGRIVATAAAKHLTPVTLELGGKNPIFLDENYDIAFAARRMLWGRTCNAGQLCLSPDYVLCPRSVQDKLAAAFVDAHKEFYPEGARNSISLARIAHPAAWKRIKSVIDHTKGKIVVGGDSDESKLFIEPTVLRDVSPNDITMEDEIFGPVLSIVPVDSLDEAIAFVRARPTPLALYLFSDSAKYKSKVLDNTRSGSVGINEVIIQNGVTGVSFSGVGASGYGGYKGKYGFDTFSHHRNLIDPPRWLEYTLKFRYPPYTPEKAKQANRANGRKLPFARPGTTQVHWKLWLALAVLIAVASRKLASISN